MSDDKYIDQRILKFKQDFANDPSIFDQIRPYDPLEKHSYKHGQFCKIKNGVVAIVVIGKKKDGSRKMRLRFVTGRTAGTGAQKQKKTSSNKKKIVEQDDEEEYESEEQEDEEDEEEEESEEDDDIYTKPDTKKFQKQSTKANDETDKVLALKNILIQCGAKNIKYKNYNELKTLAIELGILKPLRHDLDDDDFY